MTNVINILSWVGGIVFWGMTVVFLFSHLAELGYKIRHKQPEIIKSLISVLILGAIAALGVMRVLGK